MNVRQITLAAGAAGWGLLAAERAAAYCAMCQTALANSSEGQQLAAGLNGGILFLFAAPFLVAGVVLGLIGREQLKLAARRVVASGAAKLAFEKTSCLVPQRKQILRSAQDNSRRGAV